MELCVILTNAISNKSSRGYIDKDSILYSQDEVAF